ncbi:MAG: hypothetical protein KAJ98_10020, partial [Spirochaetaceae bacterium]|nr:hypothetical protein [Spirochaetaceae bacterium]
DEAIELVEDMAGIQNARILEINPGNITFSFPSIFPALAVFLDLQPANPMEMVPDDLRDLIEFYKTVSAYERGEALFLMPYTLKELDLDDRD